MSPTSDNGFIEKNKHLLYIMKDHGQDIVLLSKEEDIKQGFTKL